MAIRVATRLLLCFRETHCGIWNVRKMGITLGSSPCSNPCSGLVAGETVTISRRIQTATNPGSVTFLIDNASRAATDRIVATLTSGNSSDGIWTVTWTVSQTILDNVWNVRTQLLWGTEYATS